MEAQPQSINKWKSTQGSAEGGSGNRGRCPWSSVEQNRCSQAIAQTVNERSADKKSHKSNASLEGKLQPSGKVLPFPERSCGQCVLANAQVGGSDHQRFLSGLKPHTAYAEFSFFPKALLRWRERKGLKISAAAQGLGVAAST